MLTLSNFNTAIISSEKLNTANFGGYSFYLLSLELTTCFILNAIAFGRTRFEFVPRFCITG